MDQHTVHLFVFDTLADWEPSFALAGINNPAFQVQPGRYGVRTVGLGLEPVTTMGGIRILPDMTLDDLTPAHSALLILPGGLAWDELRNVEAVAKAKEFLASGVPVAAICGATAALARAGLLDDRRHTSNAREYLAATNYRGASRYQDQPAVDDANLITAGGAAAVDFACSIFRRLGIYGPETIDAWRNLFKTADPAYFPTFAQAAARKA
jgi:putative intracellular protease/amidase